MYEANVDDVSYRLVAIYTPIREDGVEGQPVSASTDPIAVGNFWNPIFHGYSSSMILQITLLLHSSFFSFFAFYIYWCKLKLSSFWVSSCSASMYPTLWAYCMNIWTWCFFFFFPSPFYYPLSIKVYKLPCYMPIAFKKLELY